MTAASASSRSLVDTLPTMRAGVPDEQVNQDGTCASPREVRARDPGVVRSRPDTGLVRPGVTARNDRVGVDDMKGGS